MKHDYTSSGDLVAFLTESNCIEGIMRDPTVAEYKVALEFMELDEIRIDDLCNAQAIFAPGKPLREHVGQNVRLGGYRPPPGGPDVKVALLSLLARLDYQFPWHTHIEFEKLHPFEDGNGRIGRLLWAWRMEQLEANPFGIPFLQRFYYQTLGNAKVQ